MEKLGLEPRQGSAETAPMLVKGREHLELEIQDEGLDMCIDSLEEDCADDSGKDCADDLEEEKCEQQEQQQKQEQEQRVGKSQASTVMPFIHGVRSTAGRALGDARVGGHASMVLIFSHSVRQGCRKRGARLRRLRRGEPEGGC